MARLLPVSELELQECCRADSTTAAALQAWEAQAAGPNCVTRPEMLHAASHCPLLKLFLSMKAPFLATLVSAWVALVPVAGCWGTQLKLQLLGNSQQQLAIYSASAVLRTHRGLK